MSDLLPCPFCEIKNVSTLNIGGEPVPYFIRHHCKAAETVFVMPVSVWNSRPGEDALRKALKDCTDGYQSMMNLYHVDSVKDGFMKEGDVTNKVIETARKLLEKKHD